MDIDEILYKLNKKLTNSLIWMRCITPLSILAMIICLLTDSIEGLVAVVGVGILIIVFIDNPKEYQKKLVRSVFEFYFTDVEISKNGLAYDVVKKSKLFPYGNNYQSNSLISGMYHGVRFRKSNVRLQNVVRRGAATATSVCFLGPWLVFDFPKTFSSYLFVKKKTFFIENPKEQISSIKRFKMENEQFNKIYQVYGVSEHEVFSVLTSHFMELFLELNEQLPGILCIAFVDDQIHVLLDKENISFEISALSEADAKELDRQVRFLVQLIDLLNMTVN